MGPWSSSKKLLNVYLSTTCKDQVENEIHFIVECPLYAALREKYNIVSFSESTEHFVKLFTSKDINMLKNLSDYIKDALLLRDSMFHPNTRSHTNDASDGGKFMLIDFYV